MRELGRTLDRHGQMVLRPEHPRADRETHEEEVGECSACACDLDKDKFMAPCGHLYCLDCLTHTVQLAMAGGVQFPPRCCGLNYSNHKILPLLPRDLAEAYRSKHEELSDTRPSYCHVATCSTYLNKRAKKGTEATCPKCKEMTCLLCQKATHTGECPVDPEEKTARDAAKKLGYQTCPGCKAVVQLELGCNHITCRCRTEFCYVCGSIWKSCNCQAFERFDFGMPLDPAQVALPAPAPHVGLPHLPFWPNAPWHLALDPQFDPIPALDPIPAQLPQQQPRARAHHFRFPGRNLLDEFNPVQRRHRRQQEQQTLNFPPPPPPPVGPWQEQRLQEQRELLGGGMFGNMLDRDRQRPPPGNVLRDTVLIDRTLDHAHLFPRWRDSGAYLAARHTLRMRIDHPRIPRTVRPPHDIMLEEFDTLHGYLAPSEDSFRNRRAPLTQRAQDTLRARAWNELMRLAQLQQIQMPTRDGRAGYLLGFHEVRDRAALEVWNLLPANERTELVRVFRLQDQARREMREQVQADRRDGPPLATPEQRNAREEVERMIAETRQETEGYLEEARQRLREHEVDRDERSTRWE